MNFQGVGRRTKQEKDTPPYFIPPHHASINEKKSHGQIKIAFVTSLF